MSDLSGLARLGANPELKYVGDGDDKQPVCEMRVRFLNAKKDKKTGEWIDQGFWAQVNVWGYCAEPAAKMLSKGDRIFIDGEMVMNTWPDKDDDTLERSGVRVDTRLVAPYLPDIDTLSYRERKEKDSGDPASQSQTSGASTDEAAA